MVFPRWSFATISDPEETGLLSEYKTVPYNSSGASNVAVTFTVVLVALVVLFAAETVNGIANRHMINKSMLNFLMISPYL